MPSTTSSSLSRALAVFDGDHAFLADLVHRVGNDLPIDSSLLAEMEPTWAISLLVVVALLAFFSSLDRADGLVDAALEVHQVHAGGTYFMPSRTMAWASTVAVVVPSPALSLVLKPTSFDHLARPCSAACP